MILFVGMGAEFLLVKQAATSTFFLLLVISFVDVAGGFAISMRAAQRDVMVNEVRKRPLPSERARRAETPMFRDFHSPGRSPVMACEGMAATSHPLATEVAIATLQGRRHRGRRRGRRGSDARRRRAAHDRHRRRLLLPGVEARHPLWGYNGSGRSAAAASLEPVARACRIGFASVHAVTVPGAVEAWEAVLEAHGRFGLDRALAPAIRYAEARVSGGAARRPRLGDLRAPAADPGASRHYLVDGPRARPGQ